jgi:hypothetical protein
MTEYGFQMTTQWFDVGTVIHVTDQPLPESDISAGISDGRFVALPTRRATEHDGRFFKSVLASAATTSLSALPWVSQISLTKKNGTPMLLSNLDGELTLDGVDRFEVHLPLHMRQPQQPREMYST